MVKTVLEDTICPLYDMINKDKIIELTQNPNALNAPWYGQLMRGPQVLAYIVQIYYWMKDNNVEFEI